MILPKKTLLLIGLAFTSLIGVLYAASSTILWHNVRQAEQENARQVVKGVLNIFSQTEDDFSSRFADWSAWNDSYAFVKDANKDYINTNLVPQTLTNLNVNLVLFIQPSGRIVYGTSFDPLNHEKAIIPEALQAHLSPQDFLLQHSNPKSSLTGIIMLPEGPMLITSQPILTSEAKGPIRGTLIFGRYLDTDVIQKLSNTAQLPLIVHGFNERQIPPDFQAARQSLSVQQPILVRPLNEEIIAGYVLLPDIYGKPALLLRVDIPREIYKQGKNSWLYLIATLLVVGLVFGVIVLLLLQRLVLFLKQRQQAEKLLQQAEAKYRSIFENAIEGIFQTTPEGYYLSANPALARIYGYESSESLIGSLSNIEWQLYVDPNLRSKFIHLIEKHGAVSGFEAQVYRQDGDAIWISESARAVRDATGTLLYYEGTVKDITQQKQAEEALIRVKVAETAKQELEKEINDRKQAEVALRSTLATNRALFNAIPDSIFHISSDGTVVNFKAPKDNRLPLPSEEFLGKKLHEVLPKDVAQPMVKCLERALKSDSVQICEYQLLLHNQLHDYEARLVVSAEDEVMAIIRNITERKRVEADIRQALEKEKELSELKSRFVTMSSHEFRTPLTTILSSAELLQDYISKWTEEKKLQHLQRIISAVSHVTGLLNDVLLIGKADAGKLECHPVLLDLAQFCSDLVDEIQITTKNHNITFVSRGNCTHAYLDEKLLRQILNNLLSNAIKYSPQGGTVYFDLNCNHKEVIFCVQDEGIGIPAADQPKLFDSFHRANNVGTISGTGLGLAIVKKAVDLHGGKITVESVVGVGTKFIVVLPLNQQM